VQLAFGPQVSLVEARPQLGDRQVDLELELTWYVTDCLADQIRQPKYLANAESDWEHDLYETKLSRLRAIQLRLLGDPGLGVVPLVAPASAQPEG
jgi:hypothetical protein